VKDRFNRTLRNAGFAIDALIWMDVKHRFAFVETLHGTNDNTICVTAAVTWFSYNVCHLFAPDFNQLG
jgi:hypothetical protein